jgi:DNA-binding MarR family transcriptional regulator
MTKCTPEQEAGQQEKRSRLARYQPFTWIEKSIIEDRRLTHSDIMVYLVLAYHADTNGACFPKLTTLEHETRMNRHTIIKSVRRLEECELLKKQRRKNTSTLYTLTGGSVQKEHKVSAKEALPGSAKEAPKQESSKRESLNNNVPVAENELVPKEKNEIPHAYIIKYGIERIDEVRRNTPAGAFNPVGWQIKALDGDYGHDPKAPPGWIPGDKMPTVNGPGVFWLEGSNVDVLYHGKHYHEEHKDGEIWYVPVEEYANSNAG